MRRFSSSNNNCALIRIWWARRKEDEQGRGEHPQTFHSSPSPLRGICKTDFLSMTYCTHDVELRHFWWGSCGRRGVRPAHVRFFRCCESDSTRGAICRIQRAIPGCTNSGCQEEIDAQRTMAIMPTDVDLRLGCTTWEDDSLHQGVPMDVPSPNRSGKRS